MKTIEKIIYDVHSDYDDNNNFRTFENEEEAIEYAKSIADDVSYVLAVQVEEDEFGEIVNELDEEIIWSSADEELADMPEDDMRDNDFDSYWDEEEFSEDIEDPKQLQFDFDHDGKIKEYEPEPKQLSFDDVYGDDWDEEELKQDERQLSLDLDEALSVEEVQAGCKELSGMRDATIKALLAIYADDMGIAPRKIELADFYDWVQDYDGLGRLALDYADVLNKLAIWDLGKDDPKFIEALKKFGKAANWIDDEWNDLSVGYNDDDDEFADDHVKLDPEEIFTTIYLEDRAEDGRDIRRPFMEPEDVELLKDYYEGKLDESVELTPDEVEEKDPKTMEVAEKIKAYIDDCKAKGIEIDQDRLVDILAELPEDDDLEDDDMSDEEFVEAFGKALKDKRDGR